MKRKPIKIDWGVLEEAFTNPNHEEVAYLDGVTGHVLLEGEGEEAEDLEDDEAAEVKVLGGPAPRRREDPTRIRVEPPDLETKIDWMTEFLEITPGLDALVVVQLSEALASDDPANAAGEVLKQNPAVRDAWYLFRSERLHELIDDWLEASGVESVDPPPWR
jgi:hypothetical protein